MIDIQDFSNLFWTLFSLVFVLYVVVLVIAIKVWKEK